MKASVIPNLTTRLIKLIGQPLLPPPRRIVTRSGLRVRGIFPSRRFDRAMHWESSIERDLIYRLEASWLVVDAVTQPLTIQIPSGMLDGQRFRLHTGCCVSNSLWPTDLHRMQTRRTRWSERGSREARRRQSVTETLRH